MAVPFGLGGKGSWTGFLWIVVLAIVIAVMNASAAAQGFGLPEWVAFLVLIVGGAVVLTAAAVVLFAVFIMIALAKARLRLLWLRAEARDLEAARTSAGQEGTLVRADLVTAWFSGGDRMAMLQAQMDAARGRFESLVAERVEPRDPLRVYCFTRKGDFTAYSRRLYVSARHLDGFYQVGRPRRMVVCAETACERPIEPERTVRMLFGYYYLEQYKRFLPVMWLNTGTGGMMALAGEGDASARLNRKMTAAIAKGTVLTSRQLFGVSPRPFLVRANRKGHAGFAYFCRFVSQSCSVVEYLAGDGAPTDRRSCLRDFLKEVRKKDAYEQVFVRHSGYGFDQLLQDWQQWVLARGVGTHEPPPERVRRALLEWVIPFIDDPDAEPTEKILAVRDMGRAGFTLGADALIDLLRDADADLHEEVVWALENISGIACGDKVAAWRAWWESLPAEALPGEEGFRAERGRGADG